MPDVDGYEATRRIRALESTNSARIPIYALTADVLRGTPAKCIEAGMDDYFQKPIDEERLLARVFGHLSKNYKDNNQREHESLIKFDVLNRLKKLNDSHSSDIVRELIEDFLRDAPRRISLIKQSLTNKEASALEREAHALKSVAAMLGVTRIAEICELLEEGGRLKKFDGLDVSFVKLESLYNKCAKALQNYNLN